MSAGHRGLVCIVLGALMYSGSSILGMDDGATKPSATPAATTVRQGDLIGKPAPALSIEKLLQAPEGTVPSWSALRGKCVVLEFWATWCGPCVAAIPHMNELNRHFKDRPVAFIAVTQESEEKIRSFLKRRSIDGWVGLDNNGSLFRDYSVRGIPHTVLIDAEGITRAVTYPSRLTKEVVESLLAGRPLNFDEPREVEKRVDSKHGSNQEDADRPLFQVLIRASKEEMARSAGGMGEMSISGAPLEFILPSIYEIPPYQMDIRAGMPQEPFDVIAAMPPGEEANLHPAVCRAVELAFRQLRHVLPLALVVDAVDPQAGRGGVDMPAEQAADTGLDLRLEVGPAIAIERDRRTLIAPSASTVSTGPRRNARHLLEVRSRSPTPRRCGMGSWSFDVTVDRLYCADPESVHSNDKCALAGAVLGAAFVATHRYREQADRRAERRAILELLRLDTTATVLEVRQYLAPARREVVYRAGRLGQPPGRQLVFALDGRLVDSSGVRAAQEREATARSAAGAPDPLVSLGRLFAASRAGIPAGFVVEGEARGYKNRIRFFVALSAAFEVAGVRVVEHEEDPGLGAEIATPAFQGQFLGRSAADLETLSVTKDPMPEDWRSALSTLGRTPLDTWRERHAALLARERGEPIYAVTGATISSRALTDGVRETVDHFRRRWELLGPRLEGAS